MRKLVYFSSEGEKSTVIRHVLFSKFLTLFLVFKYCHFNRRLSSSRQCDITSITSVFKFLLSRLSPLLSSLKSVHLVFETNESCWFQLLIPLCKYTHLSCDVVLVGVERGPEVWGDACLFVFTSQTYMPAIASDHHVTYLPECLFQDYCLFITRLEPCLFQYCHLNHTKKFLIFYRSILTLFVSTIPKNCWFGDYCVWGALWWDQRSYTNTVWVHRLSVTLCCLGELSISGVDTCP